MENQVTTWQCYQRLICILSDCTGKVKRKPLFDDWVLGVYRFLSPFRVHLLKSPCQTHSAPIARMFPFDYIDYREFFSFVQSWYQALYIQLVCFVLYYCLRWLIIIFIYFQIGGKINLIKQPATKKNCVAVHPYFMGHWL